MEMRVKVPSINLFQCNGNYLPPREANCGTELTLNHGLSLCKHLNIIESSRLNVNKKISIHHIKAYGCIEAFKNTSFTM